MKFGDKLVALRKKNGLSQEDLAAKLNVSRQSVSKWESNNTYPETDKIVQICNIFDCSMDDLINEKVTNLEQVKRKDKNNISINIDSFLEFITNTVNMFASMTFKSGFKCLLEMGIICVVLYVMGAVVINVLAGLIASLFTVFSVSLAVENVLNAVFTIIWVIIAAIVVVHVFKIRYLDYYEDIVSKRKEEEKVEDDDKETKNNKKNLEEVSKKEKKFNFSKKHELIIRDGNGTFTFLNVLSKMVVWFLKFFTVFFLFGALFCFAGEIALGIIFIPLSFHSMIFTGINIAVLGTILITLLVIVILFNFIFSKKTNFRVVAILLLISTVLIGIGSGVGILGVKDISVIEEDSKHLDGVYSKKMEFEDKMYFTDYPNDEYDVIYKVDNNMTTNEILVEARYDDRFFKVYDEVAHIDNMEGHWFITNYNLDFNKLYKTIIKDLENNKIRDFDSGTIGDVTVKANQETINKLMANLDKMYIYEKTEVEGGFKITNADYKVSIVYNSCYDVNYDANTGSLVVSDEDCVCNKQIEETSRGTRVKYSCVTNEGSEEFEEE